MVQAAVSTAEMMRLVFGVHWLHVTVLTSTVWTFHCSASLHHTKATTLAFLLGYSSERPR